MARHCDSCNVSFVSIGGVSGLVHERGCPNAWRGQSTTCFQCGCDFVREERDDRICADCVQDNLRDFDDDYGEGDDDETR